MQHEEVTNNFLSEHYRMAQLFKIKDNNGVELVKLQTWAFGSCAATMLFGFNNSRVLSNHSVLEEILKYVCSNNIKAPYRAEEVYFLLSTLQLTYVKYDLNCIKNLKLIDKYKNKSHDPHTPVYLYRYSSNGDF